MQNEMTKLKKEVSISVPVRKYPEGTVDHNLVRYGSPILFEALMFWVARLQLQAASWPQNAKVHAALLGLARQSKQGSTGHIHGTPTQVFPLVLADETSTQDCVGVSRLGLT